MSRSTRVPAEIQNHPQSFVPPTFYRGACHRVVDGDTLDAVVDVGFNEYRYMVIRLRGINAPEVNSANEAEREKAHTARAALTQFVEGQWLRLRTQKDRDAYGRYVADVEVWDANEEAWRDVGTFMVSRGFATRV